jgi:hypothetical protein
MFRNFREVKELITRALNVLALYEVQEVAYCHAGFDAQANGNDVQTWTQDVIDVRQG